MRLSVVVLTGDEEQNIKTCLQSLSFCDEIIVIDDYSIDQTVRIAKNSGAKIYKRHLNDNFAQQRNFALEKANGKWVLFVDADERVSEALGKEVLNAIKNDQSKFVGFYIVRRDIIWGRELRHGEAGNIKLLRLAKKGSGKWAGKVHESWDITGKIGFLKNPIIHFSHQSIGEFLKDIDVYTNIRAQELYSKGARTSFLQIVLYTKLKFLQNFILKLAFLDGTAGLIISITMSFHSFMVRAKLWHLWQKKQ